MKKIQNTSEYVAYQAYHAKSAKIVFDAEPHIEAVSFERLLIMLYGQPKIGKSTLASCFPGVYFLATKHGYKALKIQKQIIPNWPSFVSFVKWAAVHRKTLKPVNAFCLDTATNLAKFCQQWCCGRSGIAHPSDQEWGKGWDAVRDEFTFWILALAELKKGIIFIAHETEREVVTRAIRLTKTVPDLPNSAAKFLNALVDITARLSYVKRSKKDSELGEKRCLYLRPNETSDAGTRFGQLPLRIKFKTEEYAVKRLLQSYKETVLQKGGKSV